VYLPDYFIHILDFKDRPSLNILLQLRGKYLA